MICLLLIPAIVFAQYKGSAVQKDRLIQTLRSKQFQTQDIVDVIQQNGVDFKLTPALESELIAAGARPSVLDAVRKNYRSPVAATVQPTNKQVKTGNANDQQIVKPATFNAVQPKDNYNALLLQAMNYYDNQKNRQASNDILQEAVKLQPENPRAYQLLGFLNLYGAHNLDEAERYWRTAINLGGGAVLRVIHDHDGTFITNCQGSLYITKNKVRFESDDNKHTFETIDANIKEIKVNSIFKRLVQLKQGSFKIILEKDSTDDKTKFSFAPLSGDTDESKMIIRLIEKKKDKK